MMSNLHEKLEFQTGKENIFCSHVRIMHKYTRSKIKEGRENTAA